MQGQEMLLSGCLLAMPETAPRTTSSSAETLLEPQVQADPNLWQVEKGTAPLHCQEPSGMVLSVALLWGSSWSHANLSPSCLPAGSRTEGLTG